MIAANTDIRTTNSISEIVDCIANKIYGDAPLELVSFYESLPNDQLNNYLRILAVPYLFHAFEKNVSSNKNAVEWFSNTLSELKETVKALHESDAFIHMMHSSFENHVDENFADEVKNHTGKHYGNLFKDFEHKSYFDEAKNLLQTRLDRNNITIPNLNDLKLLDQGCGGGRYTTAWKLLGIKEAVGLDFSEIGLQDAVSRVSAADLKDISFVQGSVLKMPFENETFDIVYSNGVLHHTENWQKGIEEQLRVMKKGGWGWQYLIESPGGIFWDKIEILRAILKDVNKEYAQRVMKSLGIPTNRVFYMLDHVMVPINTRITSEELESELAKYGAVNIKRLHRGTDFDRVEAIYNNIPYAKEKFGAGEHRYVFNKS
jgi:ubiquinone/menaquinone biosynthesis C-methylase UbiE